MPAQQQFKRTLCRLKLIAFAFEPLHFGQDRRHFRRTLGEFEAELFRLHDDVRLPGHVRDRDDPLVAHERRIDVLVSARELLHRMHMEPALVRESRRAHIRRADVVRHIRQFVHEMREVAQPGEIEPEVEAHLELEIRHDRREVAVAHALAVAIDRPLHLHRAGTHRGKRIGHAHAAVIVRVDAHGLTEFGDDLARHPFDKIRQVSAIRFAKHDQVRTGIARRFHRAQRVVRIFLVAVEKMFGVVEHLAPVLFQMRHGVRDHREIFLERDVENLGHMQRPRLADDGHGGRLRIEEHLHLRVVLHAHLAAPGHAKGGDLRVLPSAFRRLLKERRVLRVRARPATLDVMHSKRVELFRHANLIHDRERNPGPLRAVAESGVVDGETWRAHKERARNVGQAGAGGKRARHQRRQNAATPR